MLFLSRVNEKEHWENVKTMKRLLQTFFLISLVLWGSMAFVNAETLDWFDDFLHVFLELIEILNNVAI